MKKKSPKPNDAARQISVAAAEMGRRGGSSRAANMSAEERSAAMSACAKARWAKWRADGCPESASPGYAKKKNREKREREGAKS